MGGERSLVLSNLLCLVLRRRDDYSGSVLFDPFSMPQSWFCLDVALCRRSSRSSVFEVGGNALGVVVVGYFVGKRWEG
jgi:hypothetical protein